MAYIVFDLDETLAELYSTFYFIASLRPEKEYDIVSDDFKSQLKRAYNIFVKKVLIQEESQSKLLGVLRPGILNIFEEIQNLKTKGLIKNVAIYSNNGHLESLEFIRDLIHTHLNVTDLIQECIHWGHSIREKERDRLVGAANKTWVTLCNIFKDPSVKTLESLSPTTVYFLDDQLHPDLKKTLDKNYIRVPSYNFKASFETLAGIFTEALTEANVNKDLFVEMVSTIFGENPISYDDVLSQFKQHTEGTADTYASPEEDNGIKLMKNMLEQISNSRHIGGRKHKRRSSKTQKSIKKRKRISRNNNSNRYNTRKN